MDTSGRAITLGALTELIEAAVKEHGEKYRLMFDFANFVPNGVRSYRGYYEDLAVGYTEQREFNYGTDLNCGQFLAMLKEANGKLFTGYKGGDYLMKYSTPIWVANYGHTSRCVITGVRMTDWACILCTCNNDE